MLARTYACPLCGAPVDEQARRCGHCAAPTATVRCASCFQMNVPEALHCSGCGRELGLEPVGGSGALQCPDCKRPLARFEGDAGALHDCGQCGGQFVEHALLRELLERREVYGSAVRRSVARSAVSATAPVRYVPCPACAALMNRQNFGGASGVVVDVCKMHGIWFGAGELPRVLLFVESGGLARSRRIAEENAAREARGRPDVMARASDEVAFVHGLLEFLRSDG